MPDETAEPVVLGIDASLTSTGLCLQGMPDGIHFRVTPDRKLKGNKRLVGITKDLGDMLTTCRYYGLEPSLVVLEDLPTHAKSAGLTGRAQGVVRSVLADHELAFAAVPPATLKKVATGSGRADKGDMEAQVPPWVRELVRNDFKSAQVNDLVDAFWLAEVAKQYLGLGNHLAEPGALPELKLEE